VSSEAIPTLRLSGEIDLHTTRKLGETLQRLAAASEDTVAIDISDVTFMDSTALGALVRTHNRRKRQGRSLLLVCPEGAAHRLLELSGMLGVFEIVETVPGPVVAFAHS
jgi:anti-sigma B factor antagonist